jgi:hypothetical protein
MQRFRIFVAIAIAACGFTLGGAPAGAEPPGTTDVSVAVPMTCTGPAPTQRTVTVSGTLPNRVRAGRAYTISDLTTDVPNGGAVALAVSGGHPTTFAAGSDGSSTLQLVAPASPGSRMTLQVTRADYLLPGSITDFRPMVIPGVRIACTPAAPVTLGAIKVIGRGSGPEAATTGIDATIGMEADLTGLPFGSHPAHVTVTVPTQLHPGDTFSFPDLQVTVGVVPFIPQPVVVADGTDGSGVVTAQPGGTVDLRLSVINYDLGVLVSFPIGSGLVASIPVVAG